MLGRMLRGLSDPCKPIRLPQTYDACHAPVHRRAHARLQSRMERAQSHCFSFPGPAILRSTRHPQQHYYVMNALQFVVEGGHTLSGTIRPSGNKNAALPIVCAALLTDHPVVLENVPRIRDVETLVELVATVGVDVKWAARNTLHIHAKEVRSATLDPAPVPQKIRASILLAAPAPLRAAEKSCFRRPAVTSLDAGVSTRTFSHSRRLGTCTSSSMTRSICRRKDCGGAPIFSSTSRAHERRRKMPSVTRLPSRRQVRPSCVTPLANHTSKISVTFSSPSAQRSMASAPTSSPSKAVGGSEVRRIASVPITSRLVRSSVLPPQRALKFGSPMRASNIFGRHFSALRASAFPASSTGPISSCRRSRRW